MSSYARTPHFDEVMAAVSFIWEDPRGWEWLVALNLRVIRAFLELRGIGTSLRLASEFSLPADPNQRLIEACRALEADTYLAGAGVLRFLKGRGVIARRPVDRPIHWILGIKGFPRTDVAVREAVSIPCYPALSDGEVARVIEAVRAAFGASEKG